jgi:ribosomal protein S18 acetylase RimI-like enzyme
MAPWRAATSTPMLTYRLATPDQIDAFLQLIRSETAEYLQETLQGMHLTWDQFADLVRTVGEVHAILSDDALAGFYWIEKRDNVLHIHGLILNARFQGQGIGTEVLNMLRTAYAQEVDVIELGVHASNASAKRLYERLGYKTVREEDDVGFTVLQLRLAAE